MWIGLVVLRTFTIGRFVRCARARHSFVLVALPKCAHVCVCMWLLLWTFGPHPPRRQVARCYVLSAGMGCPTLGEGAACTFHGRAQARCWVFVPSCSPNCRCRKAVGASRACCVSFACYPVALFGFLKAEWCRLVPFCGQAVIFCCAIVEPGGCQVARTVSFTLRLVIR